MNCPDCGVEVVLPDTPGPVTSCSCGWYLVGALREDEGE